MRLGRVFVCNRVDVHMSRKNNIKTPAGCDNIYLNLGIVSFGLIGTYNRKSIKKKYMRAWCLLSVSREKDGEVGCRTCVMC